MKKFFAVIMLVACIGLFGACDKKSEDSNLKSSNIEFTDDSGVEIKMDKPAKRIISLYSAHTENLFELGLDKEVIGVGKSDLYPPQINEIERFDYKGDPENIIAFEPDLVLIRPFIKRSKPEFVEIIENAGIQVVSLYPESFDEFDDYINKLALITGKEEIAKQKLEDFHSQIEEVREITSKLEERPTVYFESSKKNYKTITAGSMAARAIEIAGGENVAGDVVATKKGSSIAEYGPERLLSMASEIDIFISQKGVMNSTVSKAEIGERPGFDTIKAVEEGHVYIINEKIVSSPTFRFSKGARELARLFYPEKFNDLSKYEGTKEITRAQMAEIIVEYKKDQIFVPDSKYYKREARQDHVYGSLKDVHVYDENYDYIETCIENGYFSFVDLSEGFFSPDSILTDEEMKSTVEMLGGDVSKLDMKGEVIGFDEFVGSLN